MPPDDTAGDAAGGTAGETGALTGAMVIGAERVHGTHGAVHGVDPRTGERLSPAFGLGGPAEAARAAALAADAFRAYRDTAPHARAAFLEDVAAGLEAISAELVERVVRETGIVRARVQGELARTTGQLRLFAGLVRAGHWAGARIDPALPDRRPLPRPDIRQRRVPLGPVAVFGASNFPLAFSVAGGDTASALAAGCPVVVKAHSAHPGTSELVATAVQQAVARHGLPQGVFSMVFGTGSEVGVALVTDPHIRAVGFTGSRAGGTALMRAAAARPVPVPVYAEMSSVNPVVLLPGALRDRAVELGRQFAESLTTGAGQLCTCPGLVFGVAGPDLDTFVDSAATAIAASRTLPMLGDGIHTAYTEGVARLAGLDQVTQVAAGPAGDGIAAPGRACLLTTTGDAFAAEPAMQQEVFGAASLVVRLAHAGQLDAALGTLEGQLTATVHAAADDRDLAAPLFGLLEDKVGRIVFNGWPTGVDVGHAMVHGGPYPATSDGRSTSVGTLAIDRFLRPVAYQNVPAELLPAPVDEPNSLGLWRQVNGELSRD